MQKVLEHLEQAHRHLAKSSAVQLDYLVISTKLRDIKRDVRNLVGVHGACQCLAPEPVNGKYCNKCNRRVVNNY